MNTHGLCWTLTLTLVLTGVMGPAVATAAKPRTRTARSVVVVTNLVDTSHPSWEPPCRQRLASHVGHRLSAYPTSRPVRWRT